MLSLQGWIEANVMEHNDGQTLPEKWQEQGRNWRSNMHHATEDEEENLLLLEKADTDTM